MMLDEFLVWDAPTTERWQLIDGQPLAMAPTSGIHGLLQAECAAVLRNHLLERGSACRVIVAPGVVPRARSNMNFRIPDLGVTCSPATPDAAIVDPVMLCEILSPSNEAETRANVWAYTTMPSVQEIVLFRATRIEAEVLRRGADGSWPADLDVLGANATLTLDSIGLTVSLAALYRTTGLQR
jgi:Uma2 family endonuclease